MYRFKNLKALDVFDKSGRKLGEIEDIAIDYYEKKVIGFIITKKILSKKNFFSVEDIIFFGDSVVVSKISHYDGLMFNDIKGYDIIDIEKKSMGNLEELIIDKNFRILAILVSKGFFSKFIHGKDILLIQNSILGKKNILYLENTIALFKSMPHSIWRQGNV